MPNWLIGLIVAVLIVVAGGYYVMSSGSLSMTEETVAGDTAEQEADAVADKASPKLAESAATFTGSFFDLAARGGNYRCAVQSSGANNSTTGTVYVSGTSVRGDFSSVVSGKTVESHMLKLSDTMYVWGGGLEQGIMMPASQMQGDASAGTMQGSGVSGKQEYGWDCVATGIDASKFVKPSNIQFMDVGAMMQGSAGMMPKVPAY